MAMTVTSSVTAPAALITSTVQSADDLVALAFLNALEAEKSAESELNSAINAALDNYKGSHSAVISALRSWKALYVADLGGTTSQSDIKSYVAAFETIITKAVEQDAYTDPQAFIASLSPDELVTLQKVHGLAEPINPASLSRQQAYDLLMPPADEAAMVGGRGGIAALTRQFPPLTAPEFVRLAWGKAITGLDSAEVEMMAKSMIPVAMAADPLDADLALLEGDIDYLYLTKSVIDSLTAARGGQNFWQQVAGDRVIDGLQRFMTALAASSFMSLWLRPAVARTGTAHVLKSCRKRGAPECLGHQPHEGCPATAGACAFA